MINIKFNLKWSHCDKRCKENAVISISQIRTESKLNVCYMTIHTRLSTYSPRKKPLINRRHRDSSLQLTSLLKNYKIFRRLMSPKLFCMLEMVLYCKHGGLKILIYKFSWLQLHISFLIKRQILVLKRKYISSQC